MAALWTLFAVRHIAAFNTTGNVTFLVICFSETITAAFFILRKTPVTVSHNLYDWLIAVVGTFAPLFLQPTASGVLPWAGIVIVPGVIVQILGVLSLNRSFGLVAAKRDIKTRGMYRFVRHPLYASYVLIFLGYVASNTTPANLTVLAITCACLAARILREEQHLAQDSLYRQYMQQVRYRLIPLLF